MKPEAWVSFITREYLNGFVKNGGSAIKFAAPLDDQARSRLSNELSSVATDLGYIVVDVNAANTRVHMIDQIFFRIAEQVPWKSLSERVIARLAEEKHLRPPSEGDAPLLQRIAEGNRIEPGSVMMELRPHIEAKVTRERWLSKDFRIAMTQICLAQLTGGPDGETTVQVLTDWLSGRNTAKGAVKPYQIFSSIDKTNARHFIESLLRWIRFAGYTGILVVLNMARLAMAKNSGDGLIYYRRPAVLDTYEVLRQFIDETDRLTGCFMVISTDGTFLDDDPLGRGMGIYPALKFRVFDEIRDRKLVNPMASLIRLSTTEVPQ
ncbi:MAG TPA: BREX system ATP-binding domain-containing protein [Dehalococcoidia bacterium]|jgi:hypothetical protein